MRKSPISTNSTPSIKMTVMIENFERRRNSQIYDFFSLFLSSFYPLKIPFYDCPFPFSDSFYNLRKINQINLLNY
jgi:hypothetical protein